MSAAVCPTSSFVGAGQDELLLVDGDIGLTVDSRSSRCLFAEEVLDDDLLAFHADLHWEVRVEDFHLVLPALGHAVECVSDVALEGADGRIRLRVLGTAFDDHLIVVGFDGHVGVPEAARHAAFRPFDGHVEPIDLDGYVLGVSSSTRMVSRRMR